MPARTMSKRLAGWASAPAELAACVQRRTQPTVVELGEHLRRTPPAARVGRSDGIVGACEVRVDGVRAHGGSSARTWASSAAASTGWAPDALHARVDLEVHVGNSPAAPDATAAARASMYAVEYTVGVSPRRASRRAGRAAARSTRGSAPRSPPAAGRSPPGRARRTGRRRPNEVPGPRSQARRGRSRRPSPPPTRRQARRRRGSRGCCDRARRGRSPPTPTGRSRAADRVERLDRGDRPGCVGVGARVLRCGAG